MGVISGQSKCQNNSKGPLIRSNKTNKKKIQYNQIQRFQIIPFILLWFQTETKRKVSISINIQFFDFDQILFN